MALSDVLEVTVVVVGGEEVEDNDGVVMRGRNYLELVELEPKYPASVLLVLVILLGAGGGLVELRVRGSILAHNVVKYQYILDIKG